MCSLFRWSWLVLGMFVLAACGQPQRQPASTAVAPIPIPTSAPLTATVAAVLPTPTPAPFYAGPLFLVHEHLGDPDPISAERLKWVIKLMDEEGIAKAVAFTKSNTLPLLKPYQGRLFPSNADYQHMDVSEYADHLRKVFRADPAWVGVGELGGKFIVEGKKLGEGKVGTGRLPADHPDLLRVYDVAAEFDKVVMTHPREEDGPQKNPLEWPLTKSLERALSHNRNTVFLIHQVIEPGLWRVYMGDISYEAWYNWFRNLFDQHPNFYFDPSVMIAPHMAWDPEFLMGQGRALLGPTGRDEGRTRQHQEEVWARTPESFLNHMKDQAHFQQHVEMALKDFGPLFLAYPDRFMLGLDADYTEPCRIPWHCEEQVIRTYWKFYRAVLGRLPPDMAEKIAYKNADKVYGSRSR